MEQPEPPEWLVAMMCIEQAGRWVVRSEQAGEWLGASSPGLQDGRPTASLGLIWPGLLSL